MGKLGLKLVFWKSISSHTYAFLFPIFNTLRYVFKKSGYFSKKLFFLEFRLIQFDFRSIEILLKNFNKPLSDSIDRTCFSINRTSWINFFLNSVWLIQNTFSNFPLSLSDLARLHWGFFVVFNQIFARFFSHKAGKTFIPFLLLLFSWFHA